MLDNLPVNDASIIRSACKHVFSVRTLVFAETIFALMLTPFVAPAYNFPLLAIGCFALKDSYHNVGESRRRGNHNQYWLILVFAVLLFLSFICDIIWMVPHFRDCWRCDWRNTSGEVTRGFIITLTVLKAPTFFLVLFKAYQARLASADRPMSTGDYSLVEEGNNNEQEELLFDAQSHLSPSPPAESEKSDGGSGRASTHASTHASTARPQIVLNLVEGAQPEGSQVGEFEVGAGASVQKSVRPGVEYTMKFTVSRDA